MLGQPVTMLIPQVVGFELTGKLPQGATATDLVLTVTQMLRKKGVVDKFVEFFGAGLDAAAARRPRDDRATWRPSTARPGLLPGRRRDAALPRAHRAARRSTIALVEAYARRKASGAARSASRASPTRCARPRHRRADLAGPKRPQDRVAARSRASAAVSVGAADVDRRARQRVDERRAAPARGRQRRTTYDASTDGSVVIAAITSCTNTSNPAVLIAAGLLAQKAVAKGLTRKPWVKTSLAPGSQVVTDYLTRPA